MEIQITKIHSIYLNNEIEENEYFPESLSYLDKYLQDENMFDIIKPEYSRLKQLESMTLLDIFNYKDDHILEFSMTGYKYNYVRKVNQLPDNKHGCEILHNVVKNNSYDLEIYCGANPDTYLDFVLCKEKGLRDNTIHLAMCKSEHFKAFEIILKSFLTDDNLYDIWLSINHLTKNSSLASYINPVFKHETEYTKYLKNVKYNR